MRIYECDICGHQVKWSGGIVGNEFDHAGGFKTLAKWAVPGKNVRDVCGSCFKRVETAYNESKEAAKTAEKTSYARKLKELFG